MPARVVPRSTKKKPSVVVRSTVSGKTLFKRPSSKKVPSSFKKDLKRLIKTLKAQENNYSKMLNNEINKAKSNANKSLSIKAKRGEFANPKYFANISRLAFNNARKNNNKNMNGNTIIPDASPNSPGKKKRR